MNSPQNHEIITPAEAQFWQEQAANAAGYIRSTAISQLPDKASLSFMENPVKKITAGIGIALAGITATKYVKGNWKFLTGGMAVGTTIAGMKLGHTIDNVVAQMHAIRGKLEAYSQALEQNPELQKQLAGYLSTHVTAQDIQAHGLDHAVAERSVEFGMKTPYLADMQQLVTSPLRQQAARR